MDLVYLPARNQRAKLQACVDGRLGMILRRPVLDVGLVDHEIPIGAKDQFPYAADVELLDQTLGPLEDLFGAGHASAGQVRREDPVAGGVGKRAGFPIRNLPRPRLARCDVAYPGYTERVLQLVFRQIP